MSVYINMARNCTPYKLRRPRKGEQIAVPKFNHKTGEPTGEVEYQNLTHPVLVIPRNSPLHPLQKLPEPYPEFAEIPSSVSGIRRNNRARDNSLFGAHSLSTIGDNRGRQHRARMQRQSLARSKRDEGWLGPII